MIPRHDVHILFCSTPRLRTPSELDHLSEVLSTDELRKANRYKFKEDRQQSIVSRHLLRTACSHYLGHAHPKEWTFDTGDKGKPFLTNAPTPLHFNLSHTKGLIALALSQHYPLGVDVEHVLRDSDTLGIAHRYFSDTELTALRALPLTDQENHFFDYWTLKEAYIKACGLGLSIPLDSFSFDVNRPSSSPINSDIELAFRDDRNDDPAHWHSSLLQVGEAHRGALCIHTQDKTSKSAFNLRCFITHDMSNLTETSLPLKITHGK